MLNFTGSLRVFLGVEPVDLRKSFSGLLALVMNRLKEDPLQGALFVFSNRSRSRLKMLYWDGTGLWVLVKRLEKGTFAWPAPSEAAAVKLQLTPEALSLLTTGLDLRGRVFGPGTSGEIFFLKPLREYRLVNDIARNVLATTHQGRTRDAACHRACGGGRTP